MQAHEDAQYLGYVTVLMGPLVSHMALLAILDKMSVSAAIPNAYLLTILDRMSVSVVIPNE